MKTHWVKRGLLALGHRMTVAALLRPGAKERNFARCRGLSDAGQLAYYMGRYAEAATYLEEGLSIAREIGDEGRIKVVLYALGMAAIGQGNLATARRHLDEALVLARALGNKHDLTAALNARAQLHRMEGDLDTAEPLYNQMLALARELGDRDGIAIGLLNLAMVSIGRGLVDDARAMLLDALEIAGEIGSKPAGQSVLEVCAGLASRGTEWERAAFFYGAAEAETAHTGLQRDPTDEAFLAPLISTARENFGVERFRAAEVAGRSLSYEVAIAAARAWLQHAS